MKWLWWPYWFVKTLILSVMSLFYIVLAGVVIIPLFISNILGRITTREWYLMAEEVKRWGER